MPCCEFLAKEGSARGVQFDIGPFQRGVRDLVKRGTSAALLIVDKMTPDRAIDALARYGGRVLKSSLSSEAEHELQQALHGADRLARTQESSPAHASS
jgi:uncharacterized membrane protein